MLKSIILFWLLCTFKVSAGSDIYHSANHFNIIANPSFYDEKKVVIRGYIVPYTRTYYLLYPYREDDYIGDISKALWVEAGGLDIESCANSYVIVYGVYRHSGARGREQSTSILTNIDSIKRRDEENNLDGYSICTSIPTGP